MSPGQDGLGPLTVSTVISESIARRPEFADDYIELNKVELSRNAQEPLDELRIKRLLESSAIFSLSRDDKHRKIAYKIGIFLLRQQAAQYDTIPFVVQLVLARLGDLPSIQHMVKSEQFADYFHYFTPEDAESSQMLERWYLQFPEVLGKKIYNQATFGNATLSFTDFQSTILGSLQGRRDVVFSAPTSAGKSFLIMNYIGQQLATTTRFCAVYIVPTKALMAEVQASTSDSAKRMGLTAPEFVVLSSPSVLNIAEIQDIPKKVLVLTQERLQEMLANRMDIKVDLLILDEAQKIEDADRGIVIEDAVRELIEHNPSMQKVVISPYVRNLAKFSQIFDVPKDRLVTSTTSRSPVGQAVLFVKFSKKKEGRGTNVLISTYLPEIEKTVQLEALTTLKGLPIPSYARKAWVAKYVVTGDDPTLIYCNRPSDSRNVGRQLVAYGTGGGDEAEEVREAIDFLKQHVHPEYYLTELLGFGVGYHYGKMPQFIRFFVKDLFERKRIRFLCCTSTLLEGVNLPAKNLVIYKPRAGSPLTTLSTRNLVGRAGRLQKDYYGKTYCIEDDEYEQDRTPFNDELESINSSSEKILLIHPDMLLEYLGNHRLSSNDETMKGVRSFASSLIIRYLLHSDSIFLRKFKEREDKIRLETLDKIAQLLLKISNEIVGLDREVMLRNRSIDPRFQHDLYQALKSQISVVLPPDPSDPSFYNKLQTIFGFISVHLLRQPETNRSYRHYNHLATLWIAESSYKEILESEIKHRLQYPSLVDQNTLEEEDGHRKFVNDVIEDLDEDLEEKLKFDYTRCLKCYADIAEQILKERGEKPSYCRELPIFLEAGASKRNVLLLLDIGLSRNTAIEIGGRRSSLEVAIPNWNTISEALVWLKQHVGDLRRSLHPLLYNELAKILT